MIAASYAAIAIAWTWPLATNLGTRLAGDLGDPAFNCWVLAWTMGQALKALTGDVTGLTAYWDGNIFHPEPLTLAYSEHLTAQMLQGLPIYAATGNILAVYNVLFIATFALSGFGMYLFARDLTGRPLAAFLAGLAFAYAPYRLGQFSHLQVLSSCWMPFALFGFRRYFAVGRARALAGGAGALVMQNLSCGYYLLFFPPFAAAYCLYEMAVRRRLTDRRTWLHLALAAVAVAALTWPFAAPYLELRALRDLGVRNAGEIALFSADTHAFASIAPNSRLLAEARSGYVAPEGEGFVGFTILAFACVAVVWGLVRTIRNMPWASMRDWHVVATALSGLVSLGSALFAGVMFVNGAVEVSWAGQHVIYRKATAALIYAALSFVAFVALRAAASRGRTPQPGDGSGFFVVAAIAAGLLALGPTIHALGRGLGPGPYAWLLAYVPGFDGLRVPARFVMIVALFMAVLAGLGAAIVLRVRARGAGAAVVLAGAIAILAESWVAPLQMNMPVLPGDGLALPPPPASGRRTPPMYSLLRDLPGDVVLVEFPFGDPAYDVLAAFYAGHHRRALVNGYSGFFPPSYIERVDVFRSAPEDPDRAAAALRESGATHVLVHQGAFRDDRGQRLSDWLTSIGAAPVSQLGTDRLFELK